MYINIKYLKDKGLTEDDYLNLILIRQQRTESIGNTMEKRLTPMQVSDYLSWGFISEVKIKADAPLYSNLRISTEGKKIIDDASTADIIDEDITIRDWLIKIYKAEDKIIGNKKRVAQGISQFRANSGINKNHLAFLLQTFIKDEKNFTYSQKLENLFFDNTNVFDRRFKLEQCKLWEYYERREDFFNNKFKNI